MIEEQFEEEGESLHAKCLYAISASKEYVEYLKNKYITPADSYNEVESTLGYWGKPQLSRHVKWLNDDIRDGQRVLKVLERPFFRDTDSQPDSIFNQLNDIGQATFDRVFGKDRIDDQPKYPHQGWTQIIPEYIFSTVQKEDDEYSVFKSGALGGLNPKIPLMNYLFVLNKIIENACNTTDKIYAVTETPTPSLRRAINITHDDWRGQ